MTQTTRAKRWMVRNLEDHRDDCGEVDCTKLAENVADEFDLYEDRLDWTIPGWVFDLAVDVAEKMK